jgi:Ca2+-transporting ATPase
MALLIGAGTFLVFRWSQNHMNLEEARTVAFCTLVAFEWFMAFSARSDEHPVFKIGFFRNKILLFSILLAIVLQIAVVYVPFMQVAFKTYPLNLRDWGIVILAAGGLFVLEESRKLLLPKLFSFGKYYPWKLSAFRHGKKQHFNSD